MANLEDFEDIRREQLREQLAKWIDTYVIADVIIEHAEELVEDGQIGEIDLNECKNIWLNELEVILHSEVI